MWSVIILGLIIFVMFIVSLLKTNHEIPKDPDPERIYGAPW